MKKYILLGISMIATWLGAGVFSNTPAQADSGFPCPAWCVVVDPHHRNLTFIGREKPSSDKVYYDGGFSATMQACMRRAEEHGYDSAMVQLVRRLWFKPWSLNVFMKTSLLDHAGSHSDRAASTTDTSKLEMNEAQQELSLGWFHYKVDFNLATESDGAARFYIKRGRIPGVSVLPVYTELDDCRL